MARAKIRDAECKIESRRTGAGDNRKAVLSPISSNIKDLMPQSFNPLNTYDDDYENGNPKKNELTNPKQNSCKRIYNFELVKVEFANSHHRTHIKSQKSR